MRGVSCERQENGHLYDSFKFHCCMYAAALEVGKVSSSAHNDYLHAKGGVLDSNERLRWIREKWCGHRYFGGVLCVLDEASIVVRTQSHGAMLKHLIWSALSNTSDGPCWAQRLKPPETIYFSRHFYPSHLLVC